MPRDSIRYVLVWPGWLRLAHWSIAFGVLFQIASAWGIANDYVHYDFWRDWHSIVGQLLVVALAGRCLLLFSEGPANWRNFFDYRSHGVAILQTLRFYLSFARLKLPDYYAHNPLWKPLYLLMYLLLALLGISGMLMDSDAMLVFDTPRGVHTALAGIISVLVAAHIITALLHDWKGRGGMISAMINGHRYFHVEPGADKPAPGFGRIADIEVTIDRGDREQ